MTPARIATLWGVGHSITIALAGSAILGLRGTVSPRITHAFELAVAAMHGLPGSAALALDLLPFIPDAARWVDPPTRARGEP